MKCNRCKGLLGKKFENFLDRKYHIPCFVMLRDFYWRIRKRENLDAMSIKELNAYLKYRNEVTLDEIVAWRKNERQQVTSTLRNR